MAGLLREIFLRLSLGNSISLPLSSMQGAQTCTVFFLASVKNWVSPHYFFGETKMRAEAEVIFVVVDVNILKCFKAEYICL